MLKKTIALLLSITLLLGCTSCGKTVTTDSDSAALTDSGSNEAAQEKSEDTSSEVTDLAQSDETSDIDYTTGTPWLDIDLEGNVTADTEANLKDNFALAVNKEKILDLEIPEGYSSGGTVMNLILKATEDTKNLFKGDVPTDPEGKLAYDYYWLLMDWDSRNAEGIKPLKEVTDRVEDIETIDDLKDYILNTDLEDRFAKLWTGNSDADLMDTDNHLFLVSSCSLLLGDSAEYSKLTDYGKIKKDAITDLLQKLLTKLGYSEDEAGKKIENCFAFETLVAPTIGSNEFKKSPDYMSKIYNIYSYDDMRELQGNVPVLELFEKDGYPKEDKYMVMYPDYITKLNEVLTEDNLEIIKDYYICQDAVMSADSLDRECYEWIFDCNNAITGATGMLPDEDVFSQQVSNVLKWQVGKLYSVTYLKEEDRARISAMLDEVFDAYHEVIEDADFLSDETKQKAIEKLDSINKEVLYPTDWSAYASDGLTFKSKDEGGTLWDATKKIKAYELKKNLEEHSKPVNKTEWPSTPNKVNCSYSPIANTIYIYGAFCQGELYNSEMSDEELFGKIGWVAGHEISHAFDSSGAQFDKNGNMVNWWTDEDYAAFKERNDKLAAYYNNMHPWEGQDFLGDIMTGEAGADMAGMKAVLIMAKDKKDFDYDKLFRAVGDVWLTKGTLQDAYAQINNEHPMAYLRVNCTLQQFDEFLDFYDIKEGDAMYLAPGDRVIVW